MDNDNTKQQSATDEEATNGQKDKFVRDFVEDIKDFAANLEMLVANDMEEVEKMYNKGVIKNGVDELVRLNSMTLDWANREMNQLMETNNKLRAKLTKCTAQLAELDRHARVAEFKLKTKPTSKMTQPTTDESEEDHSAKAL
jgi:hypothetical protein